MKMTHTQKSTRNECWGGHKEAQGETLGSTMKMTKTQASSKGESSGDHKEGRSVLKLTY